MLVGGALDEVIAVVLIFISDSLILDRQSEQNHVVARCIKKDRNFINTDIVQ
jgi:hypothetical protein